jgi:hypothetical protein
VRTNTVELIIMGALLAFGATGAAGCPPPVPVPAPADASLDSDVPPDPCALETKKCPPCNCQQDAAAEASPTIKDAAPEVTVVDSGPATPCTRACANLAAHGCQDMGPNCVQTCEHLTTNKLVPFSPECVFGATTIQSLRKCPVISCKQ